jgi:dUTP pyrophosphatase|tara:strand:+ start:958 stop:1341 length:384 start_codon:yes stop_codon:yes gene_type:complete
MDLYAAIEKPIIIPRGKFNLQDNMAIIPCGISVSLPIGFELQIRPRSGLAARHHITVLNTPGTIDSDYRGEIKVILINHNKMEGFRVNPGDRIAQMVPQMVPQIEWDLKEELDDTTRGSDGFGSTGV